MYFEDGYIGTYKGTAVYRITKEQFIEEGYYDNPNDIFIINDLIIVNNLVVGEFDISKKEIIELPVTEVRQYYTQTPSIIAEEPVKDCGSDTVVATGWKTANDILKSVYM
mgnify:CR=1 FL=1